MINDKKDIKFCVKYDLILLKNVYVKKGYLWMMELETFIYFFTLPLSDHINVHYLYNRKNIRFFFFWQI